MTVICQEVKVRSTVKEPANCTHCRHAVPSTHSFYCTKLKQHIKHTTRCPHFEPEPIEYKLYKRM